jgi:hypothetical protein
VSLLNENVVTAFKLEAVYGQDALPAGADAIVTSQVRLTPLEMKTVSRELDKPNSGSDLELTVTYNAKIEFRTELVGSGALGTAPAFGKMFKACRCQETIVAATSVAYRPYRASTDSATIKFWLDGNLHTLLGARGTFTIGVDSQGIPYVAWTFWGLYVAPAANANPALLGGWDAFQIPQPVNFEHTPIPTLHGYAGVYKRFTFDAGNNVMPFDNPGEREIRITRHAAKGSIVMLAPPVATKNYFTAAKDSVLGTMKVEHGSVAANRWFFQAALNTVQITNPRYGDDEGRATIEADLNFVPTSAGNDEWELRFAAA